MSPWEWDLSLLRGIDPCASIGSGSVCDVKGVIVCTRHVWCSQIHVALRLQQALIIYYVLHYDVGLDTDNRLRLTLAAC